MIEHLLFLNFKAILSCGVVKEINKDIRDYIVSFEYDFQKYYIVSNGSSLDLKVTFVDDTVCTVNNRYFITTKAIKHISSVEGKVARRPVLGIVSLDKKNAEYVEMDFKVINSAEICKLFKSEYILSKDVAKDYLFKIPVDPKLIQYITNVRSSYISVNYSPKGMHNTYSDSLLIDGSIYTNNFTAVFRCLNNLKEAVKHQNSYNTQEEQLKTSLRKLKLNVNMAVNSDNIYSLITKINEFNKEIEKEIKL